MPTSPQRGYALVAALATLLLSALIGTASWQTAQLQLRVSQQQERIHVAHRLAHTALRQHVQQLKEGTLSPAAPGLSVSLAAPTMPTLGLAQTLQPRAADPSISLQSTMTGLSAQALGLDARYDTWRIVKIQTQAQIRQIRANAVALISLDPTATVLSWRVEEGELTP